MTNTTTTPPRPPGLVAAIAAAAALVDAADLLAKLQALDPDRLDPLADVFADQARHNPDVSAGLIVLHRLVDETIYRSDVWKDF